MKKLMYGKDMEVFIFGNLFPKEKFLDKQDQVGLKRMLKRGKYLLKE
jgi:hypothetical protein